MVVESREVSIKLLLMCRLVIVRGQTGAEPAQKREQTRCRDPAEQLL
jgi:hypothetical protein